MGMHPVDSRRPEDLISQLALREVFCEKNLIPGPGGGYLIGLQFGIGYSLSIYELRFGQGFDVWFGYKISITVH
jgi:hypothetical protein